MTFSLYPRLVIARKRAVFALRAEFLFLSFPKEKETKKKGNLRACALKNPPIAQNCYAQSKRIGLPLSQLRVALCRALSCFVALRRALRGNLYEAGRKKQGRPLVAPAAGIAAKYEFRWSEFDFALLLLC